MLWNYPLFAYYCLVNKYQNLSPRKPVSSRRRPGSIFNTNVWFIILASEAYFSVGPGLRRDDTALRDDRGPTPCGSLFTLIVELCGKKCFIVENCGIFTITYKAFLTVFKSRVLGEKVKAPCETLRRARPLCFAALLELRSIPKAELSCRPGTVSDCNWIVAIQWC